MIAGGFTCQRYGFNVGADKFSLLTIENGKTSIMRLSEWTLISQSQKSHSDRLLAYWNTEKFPKFARPADNVIIRICNTAQNYVTPISADGNNVNLEAEMMDEAKTGTQYTILATLMSRSYQGLQSVIRGQL